MRLHYARFACALYVGRARVRVCVYMCARARVCTKCLLVCLYETYATSYIHIFTRDISARAGATRFLTLIPSRELDARALA